MRRKMQQLGIELEDINMDMFSPEASASSVNESVMTPPPIDSSAPVAEEEYNVDAGDLPSDFTLLPATAGDTAHPVPQEAIVVEEEYDLNAGSTLELLDSFSAFLATTAADTVVEEEVLGFGSDFEDEDSDEEEAEAEDKGEGAAAADAETGQQQQQQQVWCAKAGVPRAWEESMHSPFLFSSLLRSFPRQAPSPFTRGSSSRRSKRPINDQPSVF